MNKNTSDAVFSLAYRFWAKVHRSSPENCWEWTAYRTRAGYGRINISASLGAEYAHRIAYLFEHGAIPDGMDVLHRCNNPTCCNPRHLYLGTDKDNTADAIRAGTHITTRVNCAAVGARKFTDEQVIAIRRKVAEGQPQYRLAKQLGVSSSVIFKIIRKTTYRNVGEYISTSCFRSAHGRRHH